MNYQEIRDVLQSHFQQMRDKIKAQIQKQGQLTDQGKITYSNLRTVSETALASGDFGQIANEDDLGELIAMYNLPLSPASADYPTLRTEFVKGYKSYCESVLEYNSRFDSYNFSTRPDALAMREAKKRTSSIKLRSVFDDYKAEKIRDGEWRPRSAPQYQAKFDLLLEYLGEDCSIHIGYDTAKDVVRMLRLLPKDLRKKPDTRDLSVLDAIALNLPQERLMHKKTYASYIDAYKSFFGWALKQRIIEENPFKDFVIRIDSGQVTDAFKKEQIALILRQARENTSGLLTKDYQKWGILVGVYTGARLNEIAQLELTDIKQVDGIWCFDLNTEGAKELKNKNSARLVPIHKDLLADGIIEYRDDLVKNGKTRLLFELSYDEKNGYGRNLSRWFNGPFLSRTSLKTDKLSFHSFRHSIFTFLVQAGADQSIATTLSGHATKGTFNEVYFKGYKMSQLQAALDLVYQDLPA